LTNADNVHTLPAMNYEWDDAKRASNLAKHGVDFADAVGALEDSHALTHEDESAEGERRLVTLGMGRAGWILMVVWTPRGDNPRLISAWKANKSQRSRYEQQF
jgi:uncharacterized DUF497 family protein